MDQQFDLEEVRLKDWPVFDLADIKPLSPEEQAEVTRDIINDEEAPLPEEDDWRDRR